MDISNPYSGKESVYYPLSSFPITIYPSFGSIYVTDIIESLILLFYGYFNRRH
jgi:hypothetical protein